MRLGTFEHIIRGAHRWQNHDNPKTQNEDHGLVCDARILAKGAEHLALASRLLCSWQIPSRKGRLIAQPCGICRSFLNEGQAVQAGRTNKADKEKDISISIN